MIGAIELLQRAAQKCRLHKTCNECPLIKICYDRSRMIGDKSDVEIAELVRKIDAATKDIRA